MICTHHTVASGTTKSYDFPWLTTAPSIFVYFNYQGKDTDKYTKKYFGNRARFQYNLKDGKFTTRPRLCAGVRSALPRTLHHPLFPGSAPVTVERDSHSGPETGA